MKNKNVSLHVADDASPEDRRGKLIGSAQIEEDITHSCIVPEHLTGSELYDYIERDFWNTEHPLYSGHVLEDNREIATAKRAARTRQAEREEAARKEADERAQREREEE